MISIGNVRTGQDFEDLFFNRHAPGIYQEVPYIDFESAYAEAKDNQGDDWDPKNPSAPGSRLLLWGVKEGIQEIVKCEPDPDVRIYCLVGSRFDQLHSADGAVEYGGERIFFDVTLSRDKQPRQHIKSGSIILVTREQVCRGQTGQIGYWMGLHLLKKQISRAYRKTIPDLVLKDDSGMYISA